MRRGARGLGTSKGGTVSWKRYDDVGYGKDGGGEGSSLLVRLCPDCGFDIT